MYYILEQPSPSCDRLFGFCTDYINTKKQDNHESIENLVMFDKPPGVKGYSILIQRTGLIMQKLDMRFPVLRNNKWTEE